MVILNIYLKISDPTQCDEMMTAGKKKKSTKQKLLDSAATLFSDKGYANTSVAEICELAGANIASVNYHFRSKDELYRKVIAYTHSQAETLYPLKIEEGKSKEEKLYRFIFSFLKRILSKEMVGNFYKILTKEMAEPTPESGSLINKIISGKREKVQDLIKEIYGKPADEELIFKMTQSIVSQCLFLGMHEKGRAHHLKRKAPELKDAESFARHITDFSIAGIKGYRS